MNEDAYRCRSAAQGFAGQRIEYSGAILFDPGRCTGCRGCEVACRSARRTEEGVRWRRVTTEPNGPPQNTEIVFNSIGCRHCDEPACVEACPEGAIGKRQDNGAVLVDTDLCTGCRLCSDACPYGVPQFGEDGKMQKCDGCVNDITPGFELPPCVAACSTEALTVVGYRDTACHAPVT